MTLHQALTAAFLLDCQNAVERGTLTGTTPEAMAAELAAAVVEGKRQRTRAAVVASVIYKSIIGICEDSESSRKVYGGKGYAGNGHHWAQRLTSLAVENADVREAWGWR